MAFVIVHHMHVHCIHFAEDLAEAREDANGKCLLAKTQVVSLLLVGMGLKNNDGSIVDFTGYPVIGNQSDMQSSGINNINAIWAYSTIL